MGTQLQIAATPADERAFLAFLRENVDYVLIEDFAPMLASEIYHLRCAEWNGMGALTVVIDHGGDGALDETAPLENQMQRLYPPLIFR